ncbi:TonB-dependent siderophore receptor, partial [Microcoleus sp. herbarium7]|uniref:TonB-dependent siderophore receptor n=1 Tax=Microcoleus sp. herbarium7 TaxID=3055435 RepID=UPI002FD2F636
TRTDTPLRDIPQSIQVVPRQVLEDRNVQNLSQATETVAGVLEGGDRSFRIIRGFVQEGNFRNGLRDVGGYGVTPEQTIERVEVLRGPASVLFGQLEPGGIVNVTTRQPLSEPFYNLTFEAGNYELYRPSVDLSGPLTADNTVLYRLIASYENRNPIPEPTEISETVIAPSITFNFGDRTSLNLYYEYSNITGDPFWYYTGIFSDGELFPRDFFPSYPSLARADRTTQRYGYEFRHEFNDNLQIRNSLSIAAQNNYETGVFGNAIENDRFITEFNAFDYNYRPENYFGQIDLLGKFETGTISHQLLIGFDVNRYVETTKLFFSDELPNLDIFNPDYDIPAPEFVPQLQSRNLTQSYGIYIQNQIAFSDDLRLLIGGRYDWVSSRNETFDFGTSGNTTEEPFQNNGAFSPRIGLVYQPSDTVSLYASYSRSFRQSTGFNPDGRAFEPTRGTQYEIGARTELLDNRLSANLAAYYLTKTNVTTPDPSNPLFSVQSGEQRSQGIELDVTGEILPGWNIILAYAYTDAEVTKDNSIPEGNRLANVPENQASLWTTYEIQEGNLSGLGFGLGLFYVGKRQGDLANSFQLDGYLRTDAALYYRKDRFRAAINIRNLFDLDYAEVSAGGRTLIQRGDPFTITGSVSWTF